MARLGDINDCHMYRLSPEVYLVLPHPDSPIHSKLNTPVSSKKMPFFGWFFFFVKKKKKQQSVMQVPPASVCSYKSALDAVVFADNSGTSSLRKRSKFLFQAVLTQG